MNQLRAVKGSKEPPHPADPATRKRGKYLPGIMAIETGDLCGRYADTQTESDDAAGRGAGDHVEVPRERCAPAESLLATSQDLGGVDAPDPAAIQRQDFEWFFLRPGLTHSPGGQTIRSAVGEHR